MAWYSHVLKNFSQFVVIHAVKDFGVVNKAEVDAFLEKLRKECIKAAYYCPAYLTYMQSTSSEILGWMKHKLESRLPGEISITSDTQKTSPLWQKVKKN